MTILGINLLKNVVLEARLTDPGQILSELDKRLQDYFQESNEAYSARGGMDMSVLVFKDGSDELSYACAGSRFLIFNDDGLSMFKGSNEQIGDQKTDEFTGYKSQFTEFSTKDSLYLLTDGFQDQYGGIKDKRYSFRRLLELLEANVNLPMNIQLEMISKELEEWQGRELQTDDISLIGLRK